MAESAGEKSFDATPHRRQEAREQGQVVYSQDLASAAMLMLGAVLILTLGGALMTYCVEFLRHQLANVPDLQASQQDVVHDSVRISLTLAVVLLPILGLMML